MPLFDLSQEQLTTYQPQVREPADFDAFWQRTLTEARAHPLDAVFEPVDHALTTLDAYDVTFSGYGGQRIKGWFIAPRGASAPLPCIVEYIGYGGGRGFPLQWLSWPSAGYAYLVMDTRGQGGAWSRGDTPDIPDGANPAFPGYMTQGIWSPETYYYRRLMTDAVRAIEAARAHPLVDASRVAVAGGSQGGGLAVAAAGLVDDLALAMPEVPFLCHFERAIEITDENPYAEIMRYLRQHRDRREQVLTTLSYFDGVNFAKRSRVRAIYSVGLMDSICPPSTVYAAYNALSAPKVMEVYYYNNHEGGGPDHKLKLMHYARQHLEG